MFAARRGTNWAAAVVLAGVGGVLLGSGLSSPGSPPQPTAAQANPGPTTPVAEPVTSTVTVTQEVAGTDRTTAATDTTNTAALDKPPVIPLNSATSTSNQDEPTTSNDMSEPTSGVLAASIPLSISIPSIGVQSDLLQLGLNLDRTIEVPPLDEPVSKAGWYKYSPTPGQIGPTVILGHVDSKKHGPAVFYELGALQPGATVEVSLTDRTVAVFTVEKVLAYQKSEFPSDAVYGDLDYPGLRLITCGGTFDPDAGSYEGSIVAYAKLTSSHPAP